MLTRAATDPVWYGRLFSSYGESRARYNLTEPIPLQVDHEAVEFLEPFHPSGPCLRTMKISAQLCRVDTSYFTHNWETRGGRERLPSRTGPKDALISGIQTLQINSRGTRTPHGNISGTGTSHISIIKKQSPQKPTSSRDNQPVSTV